MGKKKHREKMFGVNTYTPVCEKHGKVIHFKLDPKGSWINRIEIEKLQEELKRKP